MDLSLTLDLILAVLLGVTIGYAAVLNRRLRRLRDGEAEMRALINGFTDATEQAQRNLSQLKAMANEAARGPANPNWSAVQAKLNKDIETARGLRDDLSFLLERAETLADGLEAPARGRRAAGPAEPRSEAERALMRAVRGHG